MLRRIVAFTLASLFFTLSVAYAEPASSTSSAAEATASSQAAATSAPEAVPTPTPGAMQTFDDENTMILSAGSQCDEVILLQSRLRDLGYFNYKITNYYGVKTKEAVANFQKQNGLTADGVAGPDTYNVLFNNAAQRAAIEEVVKPTPTPSPTPQRSTSSSSSSSTSSNKTSSKKHASGAPIGELKNWFSWVSKRFTYKDKVQVIDVNTGIKFYVIMVGGHNHADVEPASKEDTAKLKKIYGGSWSWSRRAVVVKISGHWVAASINGMPHGYETVSGNGMDGQVCIHFLNSKTHVRSLPDADHQAMVRRAAGK